MSDFEIAPYTAERKREWDSLVARAKNASFLFARDYMEYHQDRFCDASLLFLQNGGAAAALPANRVDNELQSHGGLTYGGVVCDEKMKTTQMSRLFDLLREHMRAQGVCALRYKPVPHIYHNMPAEEDLYALFCNGATLCRRSVATAILAGAARAPISKGRRHCIKKGAQAGLQAQEEQDAGAVMTLVATTLAARRGAKPTHTPDEMRLLKGRFPQNIRAFVAVNKAGRRLAAVLLYETSRVSHCQYIAASDEGREASAPDFLLAHLIDAALARNLHFCFGTSMSADGVDENLLLNKEGFGGRTVCYDEYLMPV